MNDAEQVRRKCYRCQVTKPLEDFPNNKTKALGKDYRCRACGREQCKQRYQDNKMAYARRNFIYYQKNREQIKETQRRWRRQNPDKIAKVNAIRRDRIKANGVFEILPKDMRRLKFDPCYYCGKHRVEGDKHIDHVIPVALGGTTGIGNLVPICFNCSIGPNGKHARLNSQWFYRFNHRPYFNLGEVA